MNKQTPTKQHTTFQKIFIDCTWGNRNNAGKNYVRPYSSTNSSAKEYMKACDKQGLTYSTGAL